MDTNTFYEPPKKVHYKNLYAAVLAGVIVSILFLITLNLYLKQNNSSIVNEATNEVAVQGFVVADPLDTTPCPLGTETPRNQALPGKYLVLEKSVCFENSLIDGADPDTFTALDEQYVAPTPKLIGRAHYVYDSYDAVDSTGYYENGIRTYSVADSTFEVLSPFAQHIRIEDEVYASVPTGVGAIIYGYVTQFDESFTVLGGGYSSDETSIYHNDEYLRGVSVDDFTVADKEYSYTSSEDILSGSISFGVAGERLFFEDTELYGLSFDSVQIKDGGMVLFDDDAAWGRSGCHGYWYHKIDVSEVGDYYSC